MKPMKFVRLFILFVLAPTFSSQVSAELPCKVCDQMRTLGAQITDNETEPYSQVLDLLRYHKFASNKDLKFDEISSYLQLALIAIPVDTDGAAQVHLMNAYLKNKADFEEVLAGWKNKKEVDLVRETVRHEQYLRSKPHRE